MTDRFTSAGLGSEPGHLESYLIRLTKEPALLDAFAQAVFRRLHAHDEREASADPLAQLHTLAFEVLSETPAAVEVDRAHGAQESADLRKRIDDALPSIPPGQLAVLLAHKRDGLSESVVAERLGLDTEVVRTSISAARLNLRRSIWKECYTKQSPKPTPGDAIHPITGQVTAFGSAYDIKG